jgi:thioredoxin-like negative regulator of GroEL
MHVMAPTTAVRRPTSWRVRGCAAVLAAGLLAWVGWLGWEAYRSGALLSEARAAAQVGAWDRVESALARRAWYRPTDPEAIELRVEAAMSRGDREGAVHALAAVPEWSRIAVSARLMRGRLLKELYRPAEDIDELRACLRLDPGQVEARRELIIIFGIERRAREQAAELWELHDRGGAAIEALRLLAQSTVTIPPGALAKDADEGSVLRRCLDTTPDDPALPAALAYFLRNRGRVAEARAILEPWLRSGRGGPDIRLEDLACLLDEGDVESARPWLEPPQMALQEQGRYWRLRADWLRLQERSGEALESDREAVRRNPRDPESRYRLAQSLRAAGLVREADEAMAYHQGLQRLGSLASQNSETAPDLDRLVEIARLCHELGRDREARGWYAAVLRIAPSHAEASRFLAEPPPRDGGPGEGTLDPLGKRSPKP